MRKFFMTAALFLALSASAQVRWNQAYQQYINQYKDIAIEQMQRYKIPASITLAQGLLESGAGRSELTLKANMSRMKTTRVSSQPLVDTVRCSVWELPIIKVGLGD